MAESAAIRAGKAFVEISASPIKGLDRAQKQVKAFADASSNIGSAMMGAGMRAAAGFAAMAAPLGIAVKKASDFAELSSKFDQVFGSESGAARKWAEDTSAAIKRSKSEVMSGLATYQAFFVGMGIGKTEARGLAQELSTMAFDLASFHNIADDDAMGRFIAAMSGSSEVLDQFGINIKENQIAQELERMGKAAGKASDVEKAMARMAIIRRAMSQQGAAGDAQRTSGGFANQMKALSSAVGDAAIAVGSALIPALVPLVQKIGEAAKVVQQWVAMNPNFITSFAAFAAKAAAVTGGVIALGVAVKAAGVAFAVAAAGLGLIGTLVAAMLTPLGFAVASVRMLAIQFVTTTKEGAGAADTLGKKWGEVTGFLKSKWGELSETFATTVDGVRDAMSAGDLTAAAQVMWAGVKLAWLQGIEPLRAVWIDFKKWFMGAAFTSWGVLQDGWETVTNGINVAWIETVSAMGQAWAGFAFAARSIWEKTQATLERGWLKLMNLTGQLSDEELAQAEKMAADQTAANMKNIQDEQLAKIAAIQAERDERRKVAEEMSKAERDAIQDQLKARLEANDAAHTANVQGAKDELAAAVAGLKAMRDAAGIAKAFSGDGGSFGGTGADFGAGGDFSGDGGDFGEAGDFSGGGGDFAAAGGDFAERTNNPSARGTFSAANLLALGGGGGKVDEIARNGADALKVLKQIEKKSGPVRLT